MTFLNACPDELGPVETDRETIAWLCRMRKSVA